MRGLANGLPRTNVGKLIWMTKPKAPPPTTTMDSYSGGRARLSDALDSISGTRSRKYTTRVVPEFSDQEIEILVLKTSRVFDSRVDKYWDLLRSGSATEIELDEINRYHDELQLALDEVTQLVSRRDLPHLKNPERQYLLNQVNNIQNRIFSVYSVISWAIGYSIDQKAHSGTRPSVNQRLRELQAYCDRNGAAFVSAHMRWLFPELQDAEISSDEEPLPYSQARVSLPTVAPELWQKGRGNPETPPQFIERVYGEWLGRGLNRAHVGHLDPGLYRALYNWLAKPENTLPEGFDLPTLAEQTTRTIDRLTAQSDPQSDPQSVSEKLGEFTLREGLRLRSAIRRREK